MIEREVRPCQCGHAVSVHKVTSMSGASTCSGCACGGYEPVSMERIIAERDRYRAALERIAAEGVETTSHDVCCRWCGTVLEVPVGRRMPYEHDNDCPVAIARAALEGEKS